MLSFKEIKELIDLVSQRGLSGLEVEQAGFRVRIEGLRPAASNGSVLKSFIGFVAARKATTTRPVVTKRILPPADRSGPGHHAHVGGRRELSTTSGGGSNRYSRRNAAAGA